MVSHVPGEEQRASSPAAERTSGGARPRPVRAHERGGCTSVPATAGLSPFPTSSPTTPGAVVGRAGSRRARRRMIAADVCDQVRELRPTHCWLLRPCHRDEADQVGGVWEQACAGGVPLLAAATARHSGWSRRRRFWRCGSCTNRCQPWSRGRQEGSSRPSKFTRDVEVRGATPAGGSTRPPPGLGAVEDAAVAVLFVVDERVPRVVPAVSVARWSMSSTSGPSRWDELRTATASTSNSAARRRPIARTGRPVASSSKVELDMPSVPAARHWLSSAAICARSSGVATRSHASSPITHSRIGVWPTSPPTLSPYRPAPRTGGTRRRSPTTTARSGRS